MTTVINLIKHPVNALNGKGHVDSFAPSGTVALVDTDPKVVGSFNGKPTIVQDYKGIINLPDPQPDTIYLVSGMVVDALKAMGSDRTDVLSPDTGSTAVRTDKGFVDYVTQWRCVNGADL